MSPILFVVNIVNLILA